MRKCLIFCPIVFSSVFRLRVEAWLSRSCSLRSSQCISNSRIPRFRSSKKNHASQLSNKNLIHSLNHPILIPQPSQPQFPALLMFQVPQSQPNPPASTGAPAAPTGLRGSRVQRWAEEEVEAQVQPEARWINSEIGMVSHRLWWLFHVIYVIPLDVPSYSFIFQDYSMLFSDAGHPMPWTYHLGVVYSTILCWFWGWFITALGQNNMISHLFPVLVHHFCVQHVRQNLQ